MIDKLLAIAAAEIGTAESPKGSNNVIYNTWFYGKAVSGSAYAWCCAFCAWCFNQAGLSALWLNGNVKETAYCPYVVSTAKKLGQWVTSGYARGDVVLFTTNGNGASHVGIIESVTADGKSFVSIEGNTSDVVARRTHTVGSGVLGAFRPKYAVADKPDKKPEVKAALDKLTAAGVINSPDYWLGCYNELPYLDELIVKMGARV